VGWSAVKGFLPWVHGRASPAPATDVARGGTGPLPGGEGVRIPEAGWDNQACGDLVSTCGSPGAPWGVRVYGGHPSAPRPCGYVGAPIL
jgi:hypothetical protein